jgi:hypothetical protein
MLFRWSLQQASLQQPEFSLQALLMPLHCSYFGHFRIHSTHRGSCLAFPPQNKCVWSPTAQYSTYKVPKPLSASSFHAGPNISAVETELLETKAEAAALRHQLHQLLKPEAVAAAEAATAAAVAEAAAEAAAVLEATASSPRIHDHRFGNFSHEYHDAVRIQESISLTNLRLELDSARRAAAVAAVQAEAENQRADRESRRRIESEDELQSAKSEIARLREQLNDKV